MNHKSTRVSTGKSCIVSGLEGISKCDSKKENRN